MKILICIVVWFAIAYPVGRVIGRFISNGQKGVYKR